MNEAKYIGLDVHQATISAVVLDSTGTTLLVRVRSRRTSPQHDESQDKATAQRLVNLLGLDGKIISSGRCGAISLDIPSYRTRLYGNYRMGGLSNGCRTTRSIQKRITARITGNSCTEEAAKALKVV